ncbi:hypothetical protein [Raineya sp.]|jgi:hypothetical protein
MKFRVIFWNASDDVAMSDIIACYICGNVHNYKKNNTISLYILV